MSVGIFDSGIGGLTVLKEVRKILPKEYIDELIKLQDSVCFHFLAQNLVVILPISTISCAIAFIILHSFS